MILVLLPLGAWCMVVLGFAAYRTGVGPREEARLVRDLPAVVEALRALTPVLHEILHAQIALGRAFEETRGALHRLWRCPVEPVTSEDVVRRAVRQIFRRRQYRVGYRTLTRAYALWRTEQGLA